MSKGSLATEREEKKNPRSPLQSIYFLTGTYLLTLRSVADRNIDGHIFGDVDAISVHAHEKRRDSRQEECNELESDGYCQRHHINDTPTCCIVIIIIVIILNGMDMTTTGCSIIVACAQGYINRVLSKGIVVNI